MIIMGRHGKKGLRRLVMGSTTAWTIGHAPCNVLVVPRAAQVDIQEHCRGHGRLEIFGRCGIRGHRHRKTQQAN